MGNESAQRMRRSIILAVVDVRLLLYIHSVDVCLHISCTVFHAMVFAREFMHAADPRIYNTGSIHIGRIGGDDVRAVCATYFDGYSNGYADGYGGERAISVFISNALNITAPKINFMLSKLE